MPSVVNLPWQIPAVGLPLAGNGKASTAPHFHSVQFCVSFLIGGGVRGINATICFFTNSKCRRSSICFSKFLPRDSRLRETAKPLPPPHFHSAQFCVSFLIGGGVKGEADKNLKQTRLRPPFFFDFEQAESFSRISP